MALTGDYYVGKYKGHSIELIRDNWNRSLKLLIDGTVAASASCMFPGRRTLTATLRHNGVEHAVVAQSVPYWLVLTKDTIEVDRYRLPLTYEKPRGLLRAVFSAAAAGELISVITVVGLVLALVALLVAAIGIVFLR
jgi:hypothetical protein